MTANKGLCAIHAKESSDLGHNTLKVEGGKIEIRKKFYDDASVVISDLQDLIFYVKLSEDEYDQIKNINNIIFRTQNMTLILDDKCKSVVLN